MTRPVPDGGYEGEEEEDGPSGPRKVRLERVKHFYSGSGEASSLTIDGVSRGLLYLSDHELEWLQQRVNGEMPRQDDE